MTIKTMSAGERRNKIDDHTSLRGKITAGNTGSYFICSVITWRGPVWTFNNVGLHEFLITHCIVFQCPAQVMCTCPNHSNYFARFQLTRYVVDFLVTFFAESELCTFWHPSLHMHCQDFLASHSSTPIFLQCLERKWRTNS